jgi:hypothetical protein
MTASVGPYASLLPKVSSSCSALRGRSRSARSRLPLETIREKAGAARRHMISATRPAGHASPGSGTIPLQILHDRIYEPYGPNDLRLGRVGRPPLIEAAGLRRHRVDPRRQAGHDALPPAYLD